MRTMKFRAVLVIVVFLAPLLMQWSAASPDQPARPLNVEPTVLVAPDEPSLPLWETAIAVNPLDAKNIVVASNASPPRESHAAGVLYFTRDGGKSWHRVTHGKDGRNLFASRDPSVAFTPGGIAIYATLERDRGDAVVPGDGLRERHEWINTHVYRSTDGGETWSEPVRLAGNDLPHIAVDVSDGPYAGRLYVASSVGALTLAGESRSVTGLGISDDDGAHFQDRVLMPATDSNAHHGENGGGVHGLAVAPDGTVLLLYEADGDADPANHHPTTALFLAASRDGGRTFPTQKFVAAIPSLDTFSLHVQRTVAVPSLAVDMSRSATRGNIYVTYEIDSQGQSRVMVIRSTDGGFTFDPPVRVSPDPAQGEQAVPTIAVSSNGTLAVTWYDRRADKSGGACYQEFAAVSLDGGISFSSAQPLSPRFACAEVAGNNQFSGFEEGRAEDGRSALFGTSTPRVGGGDYQALAALPSGGFQALWTTTTEQGVLTLASTVFSTPREPLGRNVTPEADITVAEPYFDPVSRTITMNMTVENASRRALRAPLAILITNLNTDVGKMTPVGAAYTGTGSVWVLEAPSGADKLLPGEHTKPVTVRFVPDPAAEKSAKFSFDAAHASELGLNARVFELQR